MRVLELKTRMTEVLRDRRVSRERRRTVYEFGDLLDALEQLATSESAPARTVEKAQRTLSFLLERAEEHDDAFFVEGFVLNFVGEAMAREKYLAQPIIHFLKVGLYFYGLNHIERFHAREAMDYMVAHSEELEEFTTRESLKRLVSEGQEKLREDRNFCVVHVYLNALRRRFWQMRRASEDATPRAASLDAASGSEDRQDALHPTTEDRSVSFDTGDETVESRVAMMLRIFATELDDRQRRIYLARHPLTGRFPEQGDAPRIPDSIEELFAESNSQGGKATWQDLAERFECTEKTVKREYLRALATLLRAASEEVFGERAPSSFVRRMIRTLTSIAQEKNLRIRDNAGRGLGKIVERWEIALRFVLNHAHRRTVTVTITASEGEAAEAS